MSKSTVEINSGDTAAGGEVEGRLSTKEPNSHEFIDKSHHKLGVGPGSHLY